VKIKERIFLAVLQPRSFPFPERPGCMAGTEVESLVAEKSGAAPAITKSKEQLLQTG
jgi:hypothetical protein